MTQITAEKFHELIGVKDAYKAPDRLMEIIYDKERREALMRGFLEATDYQVDDDTFRQYFEDVHAARKDLKQDFTPASVSKLTAAIVNPPNQGARLDGDFYEGCAGTGGMTVAAWNSDRMKHNPFDYKPSWYFYFVEELSERALPFLIFNLAMRGMNAVVTHCDVLSRNAYGAFFIQNERDDHMQFSSVNLLPYNDSVEWELAVKFVEERYDALLESPGIPSHVGEAIANGVEYEVSDATKFVYALCGVEGYEFKDMGAV